MPRIVFHTQTELAGVHVDRDIAPLLATLWRKGFRTMFSCQGGGSHNKGGPPMDAYILFETYHDAARFQRRSMELLIRTVPAYFETRLTERENILCHARLRLEPMDPLDGSQNLRGSVHFRHEYLDLLTTVWSCDA